MGNSSSICKGQNFEGDGMATSIGGDPKLKCGVVILKKIKKSDKSEAVPGILTPDPSPRNSPILEVHNKQGEKRKLQAKEMKPKRRKAEPEEYEVHRIMGYHRDEEGIIWYKIWWKNYSKKNFTWERVENLVNCNQMLMKHFETEKPAAGLVEKTEREVATSLDKCEIYQKLVRSDFSQAELNDFSSNYIPIEDLFSPNKMEAFIGKMEREYNYIVRAITSMYNHRDWGLFARARHFLICLKIIERRREQLSRLKKWEEEINQQERRFVAVENNEDLDGPPVLRYSAEMVLFEGVEIPSDPPIKCSCLEGCNIKSDCCGKANESEFAYTAHGRLRIPENTPIYECNKQCMCPLVCKNRVVQHGRNVQLSIFKTEFCGWGVKTLERIPKGTFVVEYLGELIPDRVANARDVEYTRQNINYIFDLDFNDINEDVENMYCVDATHIGNLARFINHSCEPNLAVFPVWIDCLDPNLPKLAFFAKKDINKGEEITFDYTAEEDHPELDDSVKKDEKRGGRLAMISKIRCQCRSANCRDWIFGNK